MTCLESIGVYRINHRLVILANNLVSALEEYNAPTREFINKEIVPDRYPDYGKVSPCDYRLITLGCKKVHIIYSGLPDDTYQVIVASLFLTDIIYTDARERYNSINLKLIGQIHQNQIPDRFCITSARHIDGKDREFIYRNIENNYPVDIEFLQFDTPRDSSRIVTIADPLTKDFVYRFYPTAHGPSYMTYGSVYNTPIGVASN